MNLSKKSADIRIEWDPLTLPIEVPVLAKSEYLKCKSQKFGWFISGEFILPFFIDQRLIFNRLVFTTEPIPAKKGSDLNSEKQFLENVIQLSKTENLCDYISMAQSNVVFNCFPDESDFIEWGSYYIDLNISEQDLLSGFHVKHRNVIKKAVNDGVIIEQTSNIDIIFQNMKETMVRQNSLHFPTAAYMHSLKANLPENVCFFVAKKEGILQGSALIVFDQNCGYYMYGGSIEKPTGGSMNLLQFEIMKFLIQKKVRKYDFVGARIDVLKDTKYDGIQRFKSRFGSKLKQGFAFRVVIHPLKYKIFCILIKIYFKLHGSDYVDTIDQIKLQVY